MYAMLAGKHLVEVTSRSGGGPMPSTAPISRTTAARLGKMRTTHERTPRPQAAEVEPRQLGVQRLLEDRLRYRTSRAVLSTA